MHPARPSSSRLVELFLQRWKIPFSDLTTMIYKAGVLRLTDCFPDCSQNCTPPTKNDNRHQWCSKPEIWIRNRFQNFANLASRHITSGRLSQHCRSKSTFRLRDSSAFSRLFRIALPVYSAHSKGCRGSRPPETLLFHYRRFGYSSHSVVFRITVGW